MVLLLGGVNRNLLTILAQTLEADNTVGLGKQRVIAADTDVGAGVDVGAALADQDVAGQNELTVAALDAQALGLGVTAVTGGANALLMCEELKSDMKHRLHLHDDDVVGVLLLQLHEVDHQRRQKGLADALGLALEGAGELE